MLSPSIAMSTGDRFCRRPRRCAIHALAHRLHRRGPWPDHILRGSKNDQPSPTPPTMRTVPSRSAAQYRYRQVIEPARVNRPCGSNVSASLRCIRCSRRVWGLSPVGHVPRCDRCESPLMSPEATMRCVDASNSSNSRSTVPAVIPPRSTHDRRHVGRARP